MTEDSRIAAILAASIPGLIAAYRFGSTATGHSSPDSDIDLAFLATTPLAPLVRFDVQEHLALQLHRDVDLVDLRTASTVMRMQVIANAIPIVVVDPVSQERFEDYVFSSYARLNEERRGILQDIQRDGRVYGG